MNAKEALKISKREAREFVKRARARRQQDFETQRALRKKVAAYVDNALSAVERAALNGNFWTEYRGIDTEKFAERAATLVRRKGYKVEVHSDTIFTGVDDWLDQFKLVIRWHEAKL